MKTRFGIGTAALALASCGGGSSSGVPDDWAVDACKTLPIAAAEAASGMKIVGAETTGQNDYGHTVLSTCNYDGGEILKHFTVALHHDKTGEGTIENHIASLLPDDSPLGKAEPVAVGKGQARWLPKTGQLIYFPDDERVINVVGPGVNVLGFGPKSEPNEIVVPRELKIALAAAN